jgi:arylformamidase
MSWRRLERSRLLRCLVTIFDISVPVHQDLPVYPGDPSIEIKRWAQLAQGDLADVSQLSMGVHTGTHVDAPAHFLPGGGAVDSIDLSACIGPAVVIDAREVGYGPIDARFLAARMSTGCRRVLLKTQNSLLWKVASPSDQFAALTPDAARMLAQRNIALVGIDYLSIAPAEDPATVHTELLLAGIVILEGLDLSEISAGPYTLICLPLRLRGAEGAPARAVLITEGAAPG